MYAYIMMFGNCLPASWRQDDLVAIVFLSGDFDLLAFAQSVNPMAQCKPFAMPVVRGGKFKTWQWTGAISELEMMEYPVGYFCAGCKASAGLYKLAMMFHYVIVPSLGAWFDS